MNHAPLDAVEEFVLLKNDMCFYDAWKHYQSLLRPGDVLYHANIPLDQIAGMDPRESLLLAFNRFLTAPWLDWFRLPAWKTNQYLKFIWLAWEYTQNGYRFKYPLSAQCLGDRYYVHPGIDRVKIMRMFGIQSTAECVYFDRQGVFPPPGLSEPITTPKWFQDRYPGVEVVLFLANNEGAMIPSFGFNPTSLSRIMNFRGTWDLLRAHDCIPIRIDPAQRDAVYESFLNDPAFSGIDLPLWEVPATEQVRYVFQIHRPIAEGHSWIEMLLWLHPTFGTYRSPCFTLSIPEAGDTLFDLPPIY